MKYLTFFILRLATIAFLYLGLAVVINPRQTGPVHVFPSALLDDRVPKTKLFQRFASEGPVEGLVLGSSRSLTISPRVVGQMTGLRYFNFAVSAAEISDMASIYDYVLAHGFHPRRIVVGLDVYRLLARRKAELRQAAIAQGLLTPRLLQWGTDLLSIYNIDYAHDIGVALAFAAGLLPAKSGNSFDEAGTLQLHGTASRSEEQYKGAVSTCAATMHSQLTRFDMVSDLRFAELKALLAKAAGDGARVDIFTTPFNPMAERQITEGTQYRTLYGEVTDRLRGEERRLHFSIYDLAATASLGRGAGEWADCVHYNESNGNIILRDLLASQRN